MQSDTPLKLYYFGIKARAHLPLLICEYAGLNYQWVTDFDWATMKPTTPFGQLPYLVDGDVSLAQSMAIARYLAKKAGLQGATDADYAMSEQLIEEQNDIYSILAKANNAQNKHEAYDQALTVDIPKHLDLLEKLLGENEYFASSVTTGDLALFSVFNIILDFDSKAFDNYPKLKGFYDRLSGHSGVKRFLELPMRLYLKRD
ncbi:Glutathione S-transferase P [Balamuthia mandrillaris]